MSKQVFHFVLEIEEIANDDAFHFISYIYAISFSVFRLSRLLSFASYFDALKSQRALRTLFIVCKALNSA
jgi:hypothetical protein